MSSAHEFELPPFDPEDGPDTADALVKRVNQQFFAALLRKMPGDQGETNLNKKALDHFNTELTTMEGEPKTYYITKWNPGHPLKETGTWVIDMIEVKELGEIPNLQNESQKPAVLRCKIPQRLVIGHPADEGYLISKRGETGETYFQALFHPDPSIAELQHLRLRERLKQPIII